MVPIAARGQTSGRAERRPKDEVPLQLSRLKGTDSLTWCRVSKTRGPGSEG